MKIFAYRNFGYEGQLGAVETEIKRGIPIFDIEGISERAVKDSRMRIKAAFDNQQEHFPMEHVRTIVSPFINFSDGEFELAAALSVYQENRRFNGWKETSKEQEKEPVLALGKLDIAGAIEPARGAYAAAQTAVKNGIKNIICCEEDAVSVRDVDGAKVAVAENLSDAIRIADGYVPFIQKGEGITASMPFDARKNAEEKFKEAMKERDEHGNDNKAAFEFVMDYISDAYSLSEEQKKTAEDALRYIEEKYYKGGYDTESHKFGEENSEQALFDLYNDLTENSTESIETFGWMDKSVKQAFAEDLFQKLGTALHMRTDIDQEKMRALQKKADSSISFNERSYIVDDVSDEKEFKGLYSTARAIEVAVAGKHSIMLEGADEKKNRLAETLVPYLTPDITKEEAESVRRIGSVYGMSQGSDRTAPFRKPLPDKPIERFCGGGVNCEPGEISLAHNGVLLMEDAEDFRASNLMLLPVVLDHKNIMLSRAGSSTVYPAHFQLVLTARSSSDGNYGSRKQICLDSTDEIKKFQDKINEPLRARIEIKEFVEKDDSDKRVFNPKDARKRVAEAYRIQRERGIFNRDLSPADISKYCALDKDCAEFFKRTVTSDKFSQRGAANILKVSLTLANMEGRTEIRTKDIVEAYNLSLPAPEKYREIPMPDMDTKSAEDFLKAKSEEHLYKTLAGLSQSVILQTSLIMTERCARRRTMSWISF